MADYSFRNTLSPGKKSNILSFLFDGTVARLLKSAPEPGALLLASCSAFVGEEHSTKARVCELPLGLGTPERAGVMGMFADHQKKF